MGKEETPLKRTSETIPGEILAKPWRREAGHCRFPLQETKVLSAPHAFSTPKLARGTTTSTTSKTRKERWEKARNRGVYVQAFPSPHQRLLLDSQTQIRTLTTCFTLNCV